MLERRQLHSAIPGAEPALFREGREYSGWQRELLCELDCIVRLHQHVQNVRAARAHANKRWIEIRRTFANEFRCDDLKPCFAEIFFCIVDVSATIRAIGIDQCDALLAAKLLAIRN